MVANSLNEPLMTVEEVAAYLRLRPETVRSFARRKQLPTLKVGPGIWRFQRSEIDAFLAKNKIPEQS